MSADIAAELIKSLGIAFIAIFFIKRYIAQNDKKLDKIDAQSESLFERLEKYDKRCAALNAEIAEGLAQMEKSKYENKREIVDEVKTVNDRIEGMRDQVNRLCNDVEKGLEYTKGLDGKVIHITDEIKRVDEKMGIHERAIRGLIEKVKKKT